MLYIIGTPIGNLKDASYRAIETLQSVDYIACEDTRTSMVFLEHYDIHKPLVSYHKFNEQKATLDIVRDLKMGKNIALISDAGMPLISDPGRTLINALIENGLEYTTICGVTAFTSAFVLSGYPTPFTFVGFLPDNNVDRESLLNGFVDTNSTLIFYCSPHSLEKDVENLFKVFGDREICIVREISKRFEEVSFSTLSKGFAGTLKGEFVVLVKANLNKSKDFANVDEKMQTLLDMGLSKTDASKVIAKLTGTKKSDIYKSLHQ